MAAVWLDLALLCSAESLVFFFTSLPNAPSRLTFFCPAALVEAVVLLLELLDVDEDFLLEVSNLSSRVEDLLPFILLLLLALGLVDLEVSVLSLLVSSGCNTNNYITATNILNINMICRYVNIANNSKTTTP